MLRRLLLLLAATLALAALGCGSSNKSTAPDPTGAQQEVDAANAALASGDYTAAYNHFQAALAKDPTNTEARFGVALSGVYVVQNDPEIAQVIAYVESELPRNVAPAPQDRSLSDPLRRLGVMGATPRHDFGPRSMGRAMIRVLGQAASDPVALSQVQYLIRTKVMPKLQLAEDHLNVIEAASEFVIQYPPAVTHQPDTIEIDKSDVLLLDAAVNGVQGWLGMLVAYNLDVPNNDFENVNAESLLAEGTAWATLHSGGALQLAAARNDLLTFEIRLAQAAASLGAETDDQSDDVVSAAVLSDPEFQQLLQDAERMSASLQGPVQVEVEDADQQPFTMQLHIGRFFVPAIDDLKTVLPDHVFDSNGDPVLVTPLTFADPTIHGIFPDMTNPRWQQLTGLSAPPPGLSARR